MRIGKCQCSIFKEMYGSFLQGKVDQETKEWMEQHKKECNPCREWSKSFDPVYSSIAVSNTSSTETEVPKKASVVNASKRNTQVIMALGFSIIIFAAVWAAKLISS